MTALEWQNLQELLVWAFGPLILWWFAVLVVLVVVAAILSLFMSLLRWFKSGAE